MPSFFVTYGKELVSGGITIGMWLLKRRFQSKVVLEYGIPHGFTFMLSQQYVDPKTQEVSPKTLVHTRSFFVRNAGSQPATKVELIFNWEPQHINLWPVRQYESFTDENNRYVMKVENLAPKENLGIEALAVQPGSLPELLSVRCEQAMGVGVPMTQYKAIPMWQVRLYQVLIAFGAASLLYLIITAIQFLVLRTPGGLPSAS